MLRNEEKKIENRKMPKMRLITVKKDVRGFCQPGVLISLLKAFPPAPTIRMRRLSWFNGNTKILDERDYEKDRL